MSINHIMTRIALCYLAIDYKLKQEIILFYESGHT
jgi:hypothetical protein